MTLGARKATAWCNQIGTVIKRTLFMSHNLWRTRWDKSWKRISFTRHEYERVGVIRLKMIIFLQKLYNLSKNVNFQTVSIWSHHTVGFFSGGGVIVYQNSSSLAMFLVTRMIHLSPRQCCIHYFLLPGLYLTFLTLQHDLLFRSGNSSIIRLLKNLLVTKILIYQSFFQNGFLLYILFFIGYW